MSIFNHTFKAGMAMLMVMATTVFAAGYYDKSDADHMKSDSHKEKASSWGEKSSWDKTDQPMAVEVDIERDSLDLTDQADSKANILEVAVLGSADFDVNNIDQSTLAIGDVKGEGDFLVEDRNNDGMDDLVAEFSTKNLNLKQGTQELTIKGKTKDGKMFEGSDEITVTKANY